MCVNFVRQMGCHRKNWRYALIWIEHISVALNAVSEMSA